MNEEQGKTIESLDPIMLEYPFVREGMSLEEYYEEKEYYFKQTAEDLMNERYVPLWEQKKGRDVSFGGHLSG